MKQCNECKQTKPFEYFHKDSSRKDGYNRKCKECKSLREKTYQARYKHIRAANDKYRAEQNIEFLRNYKKSCKCRCCNEDDPVVLEFHHLDPSEKEYTVSHYRNFNREKLIEEVQKCIVVCSNCHKKIHYGKITETIDGEQVFMAKS